MRDEDASQARGLQRRQAAIARGRSGPPDDADAGVDQIRLIADHDAGRLKGEKLTPESISRRLYHADMPDPDLIIRTSGEERLSNFLLWQAAYSELYFTPVYWPDFDREHLYEAIRDYQKRSRRFGAIAENDAG